MKRCLVFPVTLLLMACNHAMPGDRSKLLSFDDQGYGDTVYSIVYGKIYELKNGRRMPLAGCSAQSVDGMVRSDTGGNITLAFHAGQFDISLYKAGYQKLTLKHFFSKPDRVVSFSAILAKGDGENVETTETAGRE